ncbi:CERS1 synthase, partial [Probosciger aterrimus]|nr:CERS1 synthase [Probosciger aterrimus]
CNLRPKDAAKMPESAWKLLFYTISWSYGIYLLFFTDYPFFYDPPSVFYGWQKGMDVPTDIAIAYLMQCSFYGHSIYATAYMDTWRKDSVVMGGGHVVTLTLIACSYAFSTGGVGGGASMMSSPTSAASPSASAGGGGSSRFPPSSPAFAIPVVGGGAGLAWFWFGGGGFPLKVLYATCYSSLQVGGGVPFYFFFNALLLVLTLMGGGGFLVTLAFVADGVLPPRGGVLFVAKVLMGQMQEVNDVGGDDMEESKK